MHRRVALALAAGAVACLVGPSAAILPSPASAPPAPPAAPPPAPVPPPAAPVPPPGAGAADVRVRRARALLVTAARGGTFRVWVDETQSMTTVGGGFVERRFGKPTYIVEDGSAKRFHPWARIRSWDRVDVLTPRGGSAFAVDSVLGPVQPHPATIANILRLPRTPRALDRVLRRWAAAPSSAEIWQRSTGRILDQRVFQLLVGLQIDWLLPEELTRPIAGALARQPGVTVERFATDPQGRPAMRISRALDVLSAAPGQPGATVRARDGFRREVFLDRTTGVLLAWQDTALTDGVTGVPGVGAGVVFRGARYEPVELRIGFPQSLPPVGVVIELQMLGYGEQARLIVCSAPVRARRNGPECRFIAEHLDLFTGGRTDRRCLPAGKRGLWFLELTGVALDRPVDLRLCGRERVEPITKGLGYGPPEAALTAVFTPRQPPSLDACVAAEVARGASDGYAQLLCAPGENANWYHAEITNAGPDHAGAICTVVARDAAGVELVRGLVYDGRDERRVPMPVSPGETLILDWYLTLADPVGTPAPLPIATYEATCEPNPLSLVL